jgi:hypothetical protein
MQLIHYTFAILITAASLFGQVEPPHEWSVTITVVDEAGQPVPAANVKVIFSTFTPKDERVSTNISGLSNSNGVFHASSLYTGASGMLFRATKAGFYQSSKPYNLGIDYSFARWNPEIKLILKNVANPIPMYAKMVTLEVPAFEKPLGFDLMIGDWVAPFGRGSSADIVFTSHYYNKRAKEDFDHQLIVTFSNAGDGIQSHASLNGEGGSDLRSPHEAPMSGYEPKMIRATSEHPGQTLVFDYDDNRAYFFRVRTVLDEKGDVKSALYGKIYGDFNSFYYYLNPTPNDRNIEFDPNHNLLPNQHVTAP